MLDLLEQANKHFYEKFTSGMMLSLIMARAPA